MAHARARSNQPLWRRLLGPVGGGALDRWAVGRGPLLVRVTASVATLAALLVAIALVMPRLTPEQDALPAFVPASAAASTAPLPEATPATEAATGLTGSLWLAEGEGILDSDITLHPDGTIVQRVKGSGTPIGLGIWRPTGEHSLSSVVVFLDADPGKHVGSGMSTYRAEWDLHDSAESGTLTWTATVQPGDGSAPMEVGGRSSLTRLHPLPLPEGAKYPLPAEPAWTLRIGSTGQAPGSGRVSAVQRAGIDIDLHDLDPADHLVVHDDGTVFIAGYNGNGVGLWAPSEPGTRAVTAWSSTIGPEPWVGELTGRSLVAGGSDSLDRRLAAAPRRIEPMTGETLPEVDPALWPETGSVWLEETADGPAIVAYLADGTAITHHPLYGTGAGYWQPIDADTIASSVAFPERRLRDYHLRSSATVGSDEQTMSVQYQLVERNYGSEENGEASATALRLDP